jgi:uncharacterized protein YggL (DUF469 family)
MNVLVYDGSELRDNRSVFLRVSTPTCVAEHHSSILAGWLYAHTVCLVGCVSTLCAMLPDIN